MIGIIVSDSHVLYGEWSSAKGSHTLSDLKYVPFTKPIKELIKNQKELHSVLEVAFDGIDLKDKETFIAIDDELLFHEKFATDESISNKEIWEYIQWETKQKWGELGNYYVTFAEKDSPTTSILHCVTCPTLLISEIKGIVSSKKGNPLWCGPVSAVYLENKEISNAVYMLDDDSFIRFYFRGRDGYSEGKLRFVGGQPSISVIVGDKEEQSKLFNVQNDVFKFVTIDLISENKNSNLRQYRPERMIPFENVDVEVEDIPEDVSFKLLNVLSVLVKDFTYKYLINFLNPTQIQEKSYEGLGEIGFDDEGERIEKPKSAEKPVGKPIKKESSKDKKEKVVKQKMVKKKPEKKEKPKKKDKDDKKRSSLPYLLIILLAAIVYFIGFTDYGKDIQSSIKELIGISDTNDNSESLALFDSFLNESTAILDCFEKVTNEIPIDNIFSLDIKGNSGKLEFAGTDSVNIPNISSTNYVLEPIECCGGVKQYIEFDIGYIAGMKNDIWIDSEEIVSQLEETLQVEQVRVLEKISDNNMVYTPLIFQVNTEELLVKITQYLKFIGDNVVTRKVVFTNTPPETNINTTFYISVFEPL